MQRLKLLPVYLMAAAIWLAGAAASAQTDIDQRIAEWDSTAKRAEEAIANRSASSKALEVLRAEIAAQRTEALGIIERGNIQTLSIKAQLNALGPAPAKDATETAEKAQRRAELEAALAVASRPVLAAQQGYNRAVVLIAEIDNLVRSRRTAELFQRRPSPILPTRWLPAVTETSAYVSRVVTEVQEALKSPAQGALARQRAPLAGALVAIGLILLLALRPAILRRVSEQANAAGISLRGRAYMGVALLLRLLIASVAAGLLIAGYLALGIAPFSTRSINATGVTLPLYLILSYWLGHVLFAPDVPVRRIIAVGDASAARATRLCFALGIVLLVDAVLKAAVRDFEFTPATRSVLAAAVVLAGSYGLWRLAGVLISADRHDTVRPEPGADQAGAVDFRKLIARTVQVAAVAAVASVAAGYVGIARAAIVPIILSIALLGSALAAQRFLILIARAILGDQQLDRRASFAMIPLVIGFAVLLACLPALAMIWGAQWSDISESWFLLNRGVEIGGTRFSLGSTLALVTTFVLGLLATHWFKRLFGTTVLPRTRLDSAGRSAALTGLGYVGVVLSAMIAFAAAGIDLSNLAIVAGALSVGIGFGLQAIVSNFLSGIILLVERPVKEGDWIEVSGHSGIVRKIAVRATRIETFDRHEVIVPNSELIAGTVKNMTLSSRTGRLIVPVGVAYGSDLERAKQILLDAADAHRMVLSDPRPIVLFTGLGESSLDFELRCFVIDVYAALTVRSELLFEIYRELGNAGIEIPFPQRDVSLRNVAEIAQAVSAGREAAGGATGKEGGPA